MALNSTSTLMKMARSRHAKLLWFSGIATAINFALLGLLHYFWFEPLNHGEKLFDKRFAGYSAETATGTIGNLGEAGRAAHILWHNRIFDTSFPIVLSVFAIVLILQLGANLSRIAQISARWRLVFASAVVLPYTMADLAENSYVVRILEDGLPIDPGLVATASALTVTKWSFVAIALCVMMMFALAGAAERRKSK